MQRATKMQKNALRIAEQWCHNGEEQGLFNASDCGRTDVKQRLVSKTHRLRGNALVCGRAKIVWSSFWLDNGGHHRRLLGRFICISVKRRRPWSDVIPKNRKKRQICPQHIKFICAANVATWKSSSNVSHCSLIWMYLLILQIYLSDFSQICDAAFTEEVFFNLK